MFEHENEKISYQFVLQQGNKNSNKYIWSKSLDLNDLNIMVRKVIEIVDGKINVALFVVGLFVGYTHIM